MLVVSDLLTDKNFAATARGKGDVFMIVGATLYGFSTWSFSRYKINKRLQGCVPANATEELFVRKSPLYEVHFIPCIIIQWLIYRLRAFFKGRRAARNVGHAD
jgi:hypothetical protein